MRRPSEVLARIRGALGRAALGAGSYGFEVVDGRRWQEPDGEVRALAIDGEITKAPSWVACAFMQLVVGVGAFRYLVPGTTYRFVIEPAEGD